MKKNKWMRLAAILLVLCLMTTSFICGTFAKYVSKDSAYDTARVAKWGVVINAGGNLFSDAYWANTARTNADMPTKWVEASIKDLSITVAASQGNNKDNIVAPGTKSAGSGMVIGLSGKPEVAFELAGKLEGKDICIKGGTWAYCTPIKLTADTFPLVLAQNDEVNSKIKHELWVKGATGEIGYIPVTSDAAFDKDLDYFLATVYTVEGNVGDDYKPVIYNFSGSLSSATDLNTIVKDLCDKINYLYGNGTASAGGYFYGGEVTFQVKLPANTDLSAIGLCGSGGAPATLTWEWAFSNGDAADAGDTVLGDLMAMMKDGLPGSNDVIIYNSQVVTVDSDGVVKTLGASGADKTVGNLITLFNIELSATQID